jgi:phage terminase large subunit-like protein
MTDNQRYLMLLQEWDWRQSRRKFADYFPEEGPLRRELYVKHVAFFAASADWREIAFMAANRVGKSEAGAYAVTCHLTGIYPSWWIGKRFHRPTDIWAAGDTNQTVRDILQAKLCGPPGIPSEFGTGMIPGDKIISHAKKRSVADAIETVYVRHISGGTSALTFKSYDQGRESFQGTSKDIVWLDEEPPLSIYTECLLRTMTTDGCVMLTFTPLQGLSEVVLTFLPGGKVPTENAKKFIISATWDDAPHLSKQAKDELWAALPPHQRDARSKGIPQLGSGAIYPIPEEEITVASFVIPDHWPRAYALDVGWNRTAGLWGAMDRESDCLYLYSCHYEGKAQPPIHASAVKARGSWIPGAVDPASRGRTQDDGAQLLQQYRDEGLDLTEANNAVESGIYRVWTRLSTGRMKVFKTLTPWFEEYRLYRRDENGKIVKVNDHLMDTTRYLENTGMEIARTRPVAKDIHKGVSRQRGAMAA